MKARSKNVDIFNCDPNRTVIMSAGQLKKAFDDEFDKRSDEIFEECKKDIVPQLMAVCMVELDTEFGFKKKRLQRFKNGVEAYFLTMLSGGFCGKEFSTIDCINMMKDRYGIDVEVKDENLS